MRTSVYVDGFNFYYGALKGTGFKWLNPVELARHLLPPGHTIDGLEYFTARVSGRIDPKDPAIQEVYFKALRTLPQVEIHLGRFIEKTVRRPLVNLPVANRIIHAPTPAILPLGNHPVAGLGLLPIGAHLPQSSKRRQSRVSRPPSGAVAAEVHTMEEKGSDVNLAVHLLNDAWKNLFDVAVVISNDTDLAAAILLVTKERGKTVYVVNPGGKWVAQPLKDAGGRERHIRPAMLRRSQFPDPIPGTAIRKPAGW